MSAPVRFARASAPLLAGLFAFAVARLASAEADAPKPAVREERESARLIEEGLDLREKGQDADALVRFEQAYTIDPTPRARAQVALANQALGNWLEAERGLVGALEATGDPWIKQWRAHLEKALATVQGQLGWLAIEANVAGAEVSINGVSAGVTPLAATLRVPAGVLNVRVGAPGYIPALRLVRVAAGEHAQEALTLQAEPRPVEGFEGRRPEEARPAQGAPSVVAHGGSGDGSRPVVVPLLLGGAGVVLGAVATAFYMDGDSKYRALRAQCDTVPPGCTTVAYTSVQSIVRRDDAVGIGGWIAGGALLAAGSLWYVASRPKGDSPAPATARLVVDPVGPRIGLVGSF